MYKSCSKCGKIHPYNIRCEISRVYDRTDERKLRSTNAWKEKSKDIRERAHHLCEYCKSQGKIEYNNLEVHHIEKVRDNKDKLLDDYNLICLCNECHRNADSGKIDKDFLKELARQREENCR